MQARVRILTVGYHAKRAGRKLNSLAHRRNFGPLDRLDAPGKGLRRIEVRPGREVDAIGGDRGPSPPSSRTVRIHNRNFRNLRWAWGLEKNLLGKQRRRVPGYQYSQGGDP